MRKSPAITITELPGKKTQDLGTAQADALAATASDLAATIRALLASGALVNHNGRIIPNPEGKK